MLDIVLDRRGEGLIMATTTTTTVAIRAAMAIRVVTDIRVAMAIRAARPHPLGATAAAPLSFGTVVTFSTFDPNRPPRGRGPPAAGIRARCWGGHVGPSGGGTWATAVLGRRAALGRMVGRVAWALKAPEAVAPG